MNDHTVGCSFATRTAEMSRLFQRSLGKHYPLGSLYIVDWVTIPVLQRSRLKLGRKRVDLELKII